MTRKDCPVAIFVKPDDNVQRVLSDIVPSCGEYVEVCMVFNGWHMLVKPGHEGEYRQYCDDRRFKSLDELLDYLEHSSQKP